MGYVFGLVFGIALGFAIVALLFRKKVLDMTFDERQERARGKAYQYGFFTLAGCVIVYGVMDSVFGSWCDTLTGNMICFCVALIVFAAVCIWNDAYLSLRENPRKVMTVFVLVTICNLAIGVINVINGTAVENGRLVSGSVNLIIGVTTLVILVIYLVNYLLAGREEAE